MSYLLKADLHIHSSVSDGKNSPKEIVIEALEKGLDVISITDHDTFEGSIRAARYASTQDIIIIPGVEISLEEGDVLIYCSSPRIEVVAYRNLASLLRGARKNNCIVVPAHPYDETRSSIGDLVYEYSWDAIEGVNGLACSSANALAMKAARLLGIPALGNSDAHHVSYIGSVYSILKANHNSIQGVFEAIRAGRVKIKYGSRHHVVVKSCRHKHYFSISDKRRVY